LGLLGHEVAVAKNLKFIVMSAVEEAALSIRSELLSIGGVKILAEVDDPALAGPAVSQFPVDVLMVHLDPNPDVVLPLISDVAKNNPNLTIFACSESTEGPLILKAMRLGIKEFFPVPIDAASLQDAVSKVETVKGDTTSSGKLITVMGTSGGVGTTMIATNLAAELASLAAGNVAIADLDYRFGQVATFLDVSPTYTLADLCGSPEALEASVIERTLIKHQMGMYVLSRPQNFAEADLITGAACMGVVTSLLQLNEYVVTDGPTRFDIGGTSVLSLCDANLMVVQLLVPCVRNAARILETLRNSGHNLDNTLLVCNRVGRDAGHLTPEQVGETLGLKVFATLPEDWATVSAGINLGEPLAMNAPKSRIRTAIAEIAAKLHDPVTDEPSASHEGSKKGLIGRIFANS
jgi:pilus assembly protein CpaE